MVARAADSSSKVISRLPSESSRENKRALIRSRSIRRVAHSSTSLMPSG
jgi:hypothetical protein